MRTDGVQLSAAAVESIRATATKTFGADAVPAAARTYKYALTTSAFLPFCSVNPVTACSEHACVRHIALALST